jgi:phosphate uptake regulator
MERKLVKQGRNALTVTLPAKWLKEKGLEAGDSINIEERNSELVIATGRASAKTSTELDLIGCERSMIFHSIIARYIQGYDTIIVTHDCPKVMQEAAHRFIGMVIEEQTATRTVLRSVIAVPEDNFDAVLRRAAHIFVQQARTLEEMTRGAADFARLKDDEHLLDDHLMYCLRYLNKYENRKHAYRYFLICATIELAADQVSRIGKHIGRDQKLAAIIAKGVDEYVKALFSNDFRRLYSSLRSFRNQIGTRTFAQGLAFTLAEILYNYLGYISEGNT